MARILQINPEQFIQPQLRYTLIRYLYYSGILLTQIEPFNLQIFTTAQLNEWCRQDEQHYPNFVLIISVKPGQQEDLEIACYHQPLTKAPAVDPKADFDLMPKWIPLNKFWLQFPEGVNTWLEYCWQKYPDETSFSTGDRGESAVRGSESICHLPLAKNPASREAIIYAGIDPDLLISPSGHPQSSHNYSGRFLQLANFLSAQPRIIPSFNNITIEPRF